MRFEFLKEHRGEIGPIKKACGLMKVSKSGFYEYLGRKKSDAQIEREAIEGFVVEAFERHKGRYGYRRINRELRKSGIVVSEKRVLRIMQKLGLAGKGATRKHRIQKKVEPGDPRLNLVERAFTVGERNRLWVGDITYIPTREGWLYLAAVIDAFSRKVVGWSMSERITEKVAIDAMEQAVGREGPPDDGSLVFHDDRGARHRDAPAGDGRQRRRIERGGEAAAKDDFAFYTLSGQLTGAPASLKNQRASILPGFPANTLQAWICIGGGIVTVFIAAVKMLVEVMHAASRGKSAANDGRFS